MSEPLPILEVLDALLAQLAASPRVVLEAAPGAGKTTAVPLAILKQPWLGQKRILLLEPRRIAARAAAEYMARQLGESVGETVGYRIRYEQRVSARTRLEVLTEGMLTRRLQSDPLLEDVGLVIFDEFHERQLQTDLALAFTLEVQSELNPELRILLMSATLDTDRLCAWLQAPRVVSAGRSFPLSVRYAPARREEPVENALVREVRSALAQSQDAILAFLPGKREIERAQQGLAAQVASDVDVLPLHGELSVAEQAAAIAPAAVGRRKVILATNVAESSLTVPDVRTVIDSGLQRESRFDPVSGFSRLVTNTIALSSATQRAGRAARLGPGTVVRLWSPELRLEAQTRAEILSADLAGLALEWAAWGGGALRFLDPPPPGALAQGYELLERLGAVDSQRRITAMGRRMLGLGAEPRAAAVAAYARTDSARAVAALLLAVLEQRQRLANGDAYEVDWMAYLLAARRAPSAGVKRALQQWQKRLQAHALPDARSIESEAGILLAHAYPDRIARCTEGLRYTLSNGRGAQLRTQSSLQGSTWLVISDLDGKDLYGRGADAWIRRAARLSESELRTAWPERFSEQRETRLASDGSLICERVRRFDRIELSRQMVALEPGPETVLALLDSVRRAGLAILPWSENTVAWRTRVQCLRDWCPDLALPELSDAGLLARLESWLPPLLDGKTRVSQIAHGALDGVLKQACDYALLRTIEQEAPNQLLMPSGMQRRLEYALGQPPVLAVKLQELFGCAETPRIARGRVPVTLHLLSPGGRPIQVTQDLRGFWDRTYAEVRKELKGRYPRHPWPEDPWQASATHRAKPRGT